MPAVERLLAAVGVNTQVYFSSPPRPQRIGQCQEFVQFAIGVVR